jgi:MFS transporter, SP family, solute carrier family 2 (myo-inositol transporter), member 13
MPVYSPNQSTLPASPCGTRRGYGRFLLFVAGLGGLLYGIDVGIIGGALPYLEATSGLNPGQLSVIVAAVLLGSVFSTLFAGMLADWMGRRTLMILSGLAFALSIPVIALSHGYGPLFFGRLLQGVSGGLIGMVVPLYLAECLSPSDRGKGTGAFQWLLTLGIVAAALIGIYYSYRVEAIVRTSTPAEIFAFKNQAWRRIFWVSLPPGLLFVLGSIFVTESPRWLFRKGRYEAAKLALLHSRSEEQASVEMHEMEAIAAATGQASVAQKGSDSLLQRKYIVPFTLACVILFCNQSTGINSIIGYNTGILLQSGLSDLAAHWGYVIFTGVNFIMTMFGMSLVDRVGRKPLFIVGTSGIVLSLISIGILFLKSEKTSVDRARAVQEMVSPDQTLSLRFTPVLAQQLLSTEAQAGRAIDSQRASLLVVYACGDFTSATNTVRSDDVTNSLTISRSECIPQNKFDAFVKNPFASLQAARTAPLRIDHALIGRVPEAQHGWLVASGLYLFMAFYAIGPGVCVWLALTELMPARIRSNGMSIALVINQLVSTTLAGIFLPFVSRYGYSTIFFVFASFTIIYILTTSMFLPETKGKTLEEIEEYFETDGKRVQTT